MIIALVFSGAPPRVALPSAPLGQRQLNKPTSRSAQPEANSRSPCCKLPDPPLLRCHWGDPLLERVIEHASSGEQMQFHSLRLALEDICAASQGRCGTSPAKTLRA